MPKYSLVKLGGTTKKAKVDPEDFWKVKNFSWHLLSQKKSSYAERIEGSKNGSKRKRFFLHYAIIPRVKGMECDHINGDKLDNRKVNLRYVTRSQNQQNGKYKNNTSGYKGVSRYYDKWRSRINVDKKQIFLGCFKNKKDAAIYYDIAALKYYGRKAMVNFSGLKDCHEKCSMGKLRFTMI